MFYNVLQLVAVAKLITKDNKMKRIVNINGKTKEEVLISKLEIENRDLKRQITELNQALQLQQTGVSGCFSYKEALEFLQLHTPIAVKPIKKSKYKFVQPFTSKNARDIIIFSLATKLSENNKYINAFDFLTELREKSEWHNLIINDNALAGKMVEFAELYFKAKVGLK